MQDAMYQSELLSQLSYLRLKNMIPNNILDTIRNKISNKEFSTAEHMINEILNENHIDRESIKNFVDGLNNDDEKTSYKNNDIYYSDKYYKNLLQENTDIKHQYNKEFIIIKKELNDAKKEASHWRTCYKNEKHDQEKRALELAELHNEYLSLKAKYEKMTSELQQKRIEDKIPDYVSDVSKKLEDDDTLFMNKSQRWSRTGIVLSFLAAFIALYTFNKGIQQLSPSQNIGYVTLIFVFFRGFLAIGILSWVAYLCFNMASSYIHESILRKDRQHALSFGRLFLQIYGDTATKDDAIEVFKDWNRSGDSAFSKKNSSPPNIMKLAELFKKTGSSDEK